MLNAIIFLLFIVGFEADLPTIAKRGKSLILIGLLGLLTPEIFGGLCGFLPYDIISLSISRNIFGLFLGAVMSISALPVIAKILLDLSLLKTSIGFSLLPLR